MCFLEVCQIMPIFAANSVVLDAVRQHFVYKLRYIHYDKR